MERQEPLGIYVKFVPEAKEGQLYKFCIETQKGELLYKADPFAIMRSFVRERRLVLRIFPV